MDIEVDLSVALLWKCRADDGLSIGQQGECEVEDVAGHLDGVQDADALRFKLECDVLDDVGEFFAVQLLECPGEPPLERLEGEGLTV